MRVSRKNVFVMVEVYQPSGYWGFYQLNVTEVESTGLTAFFWIFPEL